MAVWQYQLFILPKEEVISYFGDALSIPREALDEVLWWRYRCLQIEDFKLLTNLIAINQSWSENITLIGAEDSNCIELFHDNNQLIDISARIDLRNDYNQILEILCEIVNVNDCIFINSSLQILLPIISIIREDINNHNSYKSFIDKLQ